VFEVLCVRCQVQLPVPKFDFRFVQNGTSNKRRPVGRRLCSDRASCLWRNLLVPPPPRPSPVEHTCYVTTYRILHDAELRAKFSCRAIRRNSILPALRQAVPKLLRKLAGDVFAAGNGFVSSYALGFTEKGEEQGRWWQTQLYTSREVCSDSFVGRLEFPVCQWVI